MQTQLDQMKTPKERMGERLIYIPSGRSMKMASLGFDTVLADVLWVRAVLYFGEHFLTDQDYRWLYRILDATTTLDPQNIMAYRFGGTLLALGEDDVEKSMELLKKGIRNNPDKDWRLYFLLGYNYFYYLEDHASAAKYLEKASRMPGHPDYLPRLAARMYAKANQLDTAIEFLREMYGQYEDPSIKETIEKRIAVLVAKKYARSLKPVVEKYKEIHGKYPAEVNALIHAGLIKELYIYPDGRYVIDPDTGEVDWLSDSETQWP